VIVTPSRGEAKYLSDCPRNCLKGLYTFFVEEKEESFDFFRYVAIISLYESFNFLILHFINNVCAKFRGKILNSF